MGSHHLEAAYVKYFEYDAENPPDRTGYPPLIEELPELLALDIATHIGVLWPLPAPHEIAAMEPAVQLKTKALIDLYEGMKSGSLQQIAAHRPGGVRKTGHFTLFWSLSLGTLMGHRALVNSIEKAMTHASGRTWRGEAPPASASQERRCMIYFSKTTAERAKLQRRKEEAAGSSSSAGGGRGQGKGKSKGGQGKNKGKGGSKGGRGK